MCAAVSDVSPFKVVNLFFDNPFSDQQPVDLLKGCAAFQTHVTPSTIVDRQILWQTALALLRAVKRHGIDSLRLDRLLLRRSLRLDEPFCLALYLVQSHHRPALPLLFGAEGAAGVTQDTTFVDPLAVTP